MPDTINVLVVELSGNSSVSVKVDELPAVFLTKAELLSAIAFIQQRRAHIVDVQPKEVCNAKHV